MGSALPRKAVDVGRLVAHHAEAVRADVVDADVIAPDDEDVGLLLLGVRHATEDTVSAVANDNVNSPILPSIVVFKRDSLCDFELIPSRIPADSP